MRNRFVIFGKLGMRKTITGFTLAEVLITLTIIGVIAALTIPALTQNIQDAQLKTAWKKEFADLNQATKRILADNGGSIKGICNDNDSDCFRNLYATYLSYTKACNNGVSFGNCWHNDGNSFWYWDGTPTGGYVGNASGLILTNGSFLNINYYTKDCSTSLLGITKCGRITIDVNGFKGPNRFGKDIFNVHVLETGIEPYGIQGDIYYNTCPSITGLGCSAKYLMQ